MNTPPAPTDQAPRSVSRPAPGTILRLAAIDGKDYLFDFSFEDVLLESDGEDLHLVFEDGKTEVVLEGFLKLTSAATGLDFDGQRLPAHDLLSLLGGTAPFETDFLAPAAGFESSHVGAFESESLPDVGTVSSLAMPEQDYSAMDASSAFSGPADLPLSLREPSQAPPEVTLSPRNLFESGHPVLTGTVRNAAGVTLVINGASHAATMHPDGTWSFTPSSEAPLADGDYDVRVLASRGYETAEATLRITIDAAEPTVAITSLPETANDTPVIEGTSENATAISVEIDGKQYTASPDATGRWHVRISEALEDGAYEVRVSATDGQQTVSKIHTLAVDAPDPLGAVSDADGQANTLAEDAGIGTPVGIRGHAVDPDGEHVTYSLSDDADGLFAIDPASGVVTLNGELNYEAAVSHTIEILATSDDGTTSRQSYTIRVQDQNDTPRFGGTNEGTITEADGAFVTDKLTISDEDAGENRFRESTTTGTYGDLEILENGTWTYSLNRNADSLPEGERATDTFTVEAADGTPHQIILGVTGTNDAAVITGMDSGTVDEDAPSPLSGKLEITDADKGQNSFKVATYDGEFGSVEMEADGSWRYTPNAEAQKIPGDESREDVLVVRSEDGTEHEITVTVNGINDAAVIEGQSTGMVTEDTEISTSGILTLTDKDAGETRFVAESHKAHFGSLEITENGSWTYTLDDRADALSEGSEVSDFVTVRAFDGTTQKDRSPDHGHQRCRRD